MKNYKIVFNAVKININLIEFKFEQMAHDHNYQNPDE